MSKTDRLRDDSLVLSCYNRYMKKRKVAPVGAQMVQMTVSSWGNEVSLSHPSSVISTVSSILMPPPPGM